MVVKSDHPVPQRVSHWLNLVCVAVLIVTGFMINSPAKYGGLGTIIYIHLTFAYLFIANGLVRIYYSFFGKYRDFPEFAIGVKDWPGFKETVRYYLFLGPLTRRSKYNPLQKLAYLFLIILGIVQALTGFAMLWPKSVFRVVSRVTGGLSQVWSLHYLVMWIFIAIIIVHLYLVFTEPTSSVKLMLFGMAPEDQEKPSAGGGVEQA